MHTITIISRAPTTERRPPPRFFLAMAGAILLMLLPPLISSASAQGNMHTEYSGQVAGDPTSSITFIRVHRPEGSQRIATFALDQLLENCGTASRRSESLNLGGIPMGTLPSQPPNRFHKVRTIYTRPAADQIEEISSDVSGRFTRDGGASGHLELTQTFYTTVAGNPSGPPYATCSTGVVAWTASPR